MDDPRLIHTARATYHIKNSSTTGILKRQIHSSMCLFDSKDFYRDLGGLNLYDFFYNRIYFHYISLYKKFIHDSNLLLSFLCSTKQTLCNHDLVRHCNSIFFLFLYFSYHPNQRGLKWLYWIDELIR